MQFWESSVFWGIAGIVCGFIGSAFFSSKGKYKKRLEYQVISTNLITKNMANIPGISIALNGQPIEDLVSTTIKFKNFGNQTIDLDDFATLEPLGATVTGQFLSTQHGYQVSCDNPNSHPYINIANSNTVNVEFDFLKPKQSFTITLWHSGNLSVCGELKSGECYECRGDYGISNRINKSLLFSFALLSFVNVMMIFSYVTASLNGNLPLDGADIDFGSPIVLFSLLFSVVFMSMFWIIPILLGATKQNKIKE